MAFLLHQIVDQSAERAPASEAIRFSGQTLTYEALALESDRLARVLVEEGVQRGDRVGLYLGKGPASVIGLYGIMKAGAAYVPLDPGAPVARTAFVLNDCGIRVVITEEARVPALRQMLSDGVGLECAIGIDPQEDLGLRTVSWSDVAAAPSVRERPRAMEQDLAYILYTSGSTGVPKGVMHTHRSALSWAEVSARTYGLHAEDRVSNHAPLHFDLSTLDYFATALVGGTTVIVPELYTKFPASLSDLVEKERLTVLYVVPFALTQLLHYGALEQRDLRSLRWVLFGGEPMPVPHLRKLMHRWPHARFSNVYGPTEVNGVTYHILPHPPVDDEPIPIGGVFENVEALVVDADDRPVESGEAGELLVRTPTMMRGYWGREELNAKAFYRRRVFGLYEDVFHRTGDLVRQRPDGAFDFLGRKDRQIKTRGYRVELDEVEATLGAHPALAAAAVFPVPDGDGSQRIEAAVLLRRDGSEAEAVTPAALRSFLASRLPAYAVPERVAILREFPQTSTGKIDRRRLEAEAITQSTNGAA